MDGVEAGTIGTEPHADDVDAGRPEGDGEAAERPFLGVVHLGEGVPVGDRLDLDDHPPGGPGHEEIALGTGGADVATEDPEAPYGVALGGQALTQGTDLGPAQSRAPGSSSSMLTSRKLSTVTRFRKRAGRYMSHTQASSSSIRK